MSGRIFVDDRWNGAYGIGRYSREVLQRLNVEWSPLSLQGRPSAPLDFARRLPKQAEKALIYSPGYNVLKRAECQILTVHDLIHLRTEYPCRLKYSAYYNLILKPAILRSKIVITVSETSRRAIEDWISDSRVRVVNAGIGRSSAFVPNGPILEVKEPYILYVGNLRAHKNVGVLLEALALVRDLRLKLVLPEDEREQALTLAAKAGAARQVDILSGLDDSSLAEVYRGAEATVMPSKLEGFGLPPLESLCCGTPVIFWRGCESVAETVGSFGRSVNSPDDAVEWAAAINDAINGGVSTSGFDPDDFSWDRTTKLVTKILVECSES